ncbi:hypothetical protein [Ascidiimonas sp. W6]|uniref:hypothetical protein n=1 Tax=Ascidiimonas meishanensis TaxID=3128903 RepID=UPI0030EB373D
MVTDAAYNLINALLFLIPQCIIIIACILYLIKKISLEGILLLTGALIALLVSLFYQLIWPYLLQENFVDAGSTMIFLIVGGISLLGSLSFAIGFYLVTQKALKNNSFFKQNSPSI